MGRYQPDESTKIAKVVARRWSRKQRTLIASSCSFTPFTAPYRTGRLGTGVALSGTANLHGGWGIAPRLTPKAPIWLARTDVFANGQVRKSRDGWNGRGREKMRRSPSMCCGRGCATIAATKDCKMRMSRGVARERPGREPCDSGENSRRSALKYAPFQLPCAFHGAPEKSYVDA